MKSRLALLFVSLFLFQPIFASEPEEIKSREELQKILKSEKTVIIKWYGQWCGFCKKMDPEFLKAAQQDKNRKYISVDMDSFEKLANDLKIVSVPTITIVKNGSVIKKFVGFKTADQLIKLIDSALEQKHDSKDIDIKLDQPRKSLANRAIEKIKKLLKSLF